MSLENERRNQLYKLLGELPDRSRAITAETIKVEQREHYVLEKLILDLNGIEQVPAYFVTPIGKNKPCPAILYNHAHGGDYVLGKDELIIGRGGLQDPPYAEELAKKGYSSLCIDSWAFGERRGRSESEIFKQMLWHGQVMWGMMVFDSLRAADYLVSRSDVDGNRIGTMGISMGSTMAWWTAALDGHGIYYYVPGLLKQFTAAGINSLIAPRSHLSLAGIYDPLTPPAGLERINKELLKVYKDKKAPDAWKLSKHNTGHYETAAMRAEILSFLDRWL